MEVDGRMIRPRQATHEWQGQCPIGRSDSDNVRKRRPSRCLPQGDHSGDLDNGELP